MQTLHTAGKYIKYLVAAAILLPLVFIAEVAYVEQAQINSVQQAQAEEVAKLREAAAAVWLANQTTYLKGVAGLNAVTAGEPEALTAELSGFLGSGTGFTVLGYAGSDGKTQAETGAADSRDISNRTYFTQAAAGQEFTDTVSGADWQFTEEVTVTAVPVIRHGEIMGVVYGVIRQETIDTMTAAIIPGLSRAQPELGRWLAWLGIVYLLGLIPLLFTVYLLRNRSLRLEETAEDRPEPSSLRRPLSADGKTAIMGAEPPAADAAQEAAAAALTKLIAQMTPPASPNKPKKIPSAPDTTPAAVVDRVLAVAAYKGADKKQAAPPRQTAPAPQPPAKQPAADKPAEPPAAPLTPAPPAFVAGLPARDGLTDLYTKPEFEKKIAARQGQPGMGMLVLSIDGMKVINNFLGTTAGDTLIIVTASILKSVAGSDCLAARIDGDKFVVLLTDISPELVEDLKKDIKYYMDLHNVRQPELPLSITTGAAVAGLGEDIKAVWQRAEQDMESRKAVNRVEARKFIMWSIRRHRKS